MGHLVAQRDGELKLLLSFSLSREVIAGEAFDDLQVHAATKIASSRLQKEHLLIQRTKTMTSVPRIDVNVRARRGQTPLMYASALAYHAAVEKLLMRDDIDGYSQGRGGQTASLYPVHAGHEDAVQTLVNTRKLKENLQRQTVPDVAREGSYPNVIFVLDY
ncbi:uncharacterized protein N7477_003599 [Penicillium maclennaniae]|uniref:uncharacterized protein n=1 Tax=Penicillium maclennaniae TaxID=1343394 RepID=UPI002541D9EA|nr:uncharacterized protein N7477_003599 [Penicillium maclennaniae]KAJ5677966.1 hypothetical protein N7477_003599 [Penicillium maclennaniae]